MLFQKSRIFKKSGACVESIICSSFKTFSQQAQSFGSKATIDPKLLYPFSQSQTYQALNTFKEASSIPNNSRNIVLLDKLTATDYSETHRAYDLEKKVFVAQKNINLDSLASWKQVNLILRQQQSSPLFAKTLSIDYDEEKQNVKIINELQNTILKDYCNYLDNQKNSWLKERTKPYIMQIIQQLTALKQLGIELEGRKTIIDPKKIFVDKTSQMLKLYDLSDFVIKDDKPEIDQKEFLEIAKQTLLKVVNGDSKDLPEFSLIFKKIEYEFESLKGVAQSDMVKILEDLDQNYDQFILDKISRVLIENPTENDEKEVMFLRDVRELYIHSAEAYQGKSEFEKAAKCYGKAEEIEENLKKIVSYEKSQENESSSKTGKGSSPTIFGKATSVLFDFSYFTFKELMTYVGIAALILIFGAIYEKYLSKKDEQKKESRKSSVFSSAWQKVKNLKNKSETSV